MMPHSSKHKKLKKSKRLIDKLIYPIAFVAPLATIPQIFEIWRAEDVISVSLLSWFFYLCLSFLWLFYGSYHREKPIIITSFLGLIFNTIVVFGIIYKRFLI